jgi:hypothetical protein
VALVAAALAALVIGRFVRLDDTSGFGSERFVLPWGYVAGVLALLSVVVAVPRRSSRRVLGVTLAVLDALLVLGQVVDDGFRFVWSRGEGELFVFQGGLGLAALVLLVPAFRPSSVTARLAGYVVTSAAVAYVAFQVGAQRYDSTYCDGPDVGDCDLGGLQGLVWSVVAVLVVLVVVAVAEVALAVRRRARLADR